MEFGNALPHDIKISGSHNKGFIVKAGCSISVFSTKKDLLEAIGEYIDDPKAMEKKYNKSNVAPQELATDSPSSSELRPIPNSNQEEQCNEESPDRRR